MKVINFRKIKDFRRVNSGNQTARTEQQIFSARKRMILRNPLKDAKNQLKQSNRMVKNELWKHRKTQIKQHHQTK